VLNVALPTLVRDLHATSHQLQWIVDAYALAYGGLVLVGGSLADRVGRNVPIAVIGLLCAIPLVPDSKNPAAARPDLAGSALSITGLGLVLWAIIEAPVYGWSSALVIGVGIGGLAVLACFARWERVSSHPMLNLRFFRARSFSAPIASLGLAMFGLVGALFVLTQFLQFNLAYSPLAAGVRMLPIAAGIAVMAPLSSVAVRKAGTKLTIAAGLLVIAGGLWQTSQATASWTFVSVLPGMILAGAGAGLVIPAVSGSVMNSLPRAHTGVGSATNGVFIQVGGALGVAVIGSLRPPGTRTG